MFRGTAETFSAINCLLRFFRKKDGCFFFGETLASHQPRTCASKMQLLMIQEAHAVERGQRLEVLNGKNGTRRKHSSSKMFCLMYENVEKVWWRGFQKVLQLAVPCGLPSSDQILKERQGHYHKKSAAPLHLNNRASAKHSSLHRALYSRHLRLKCLFHFCVKEEVKFRRERRTKGPPLQMFYSAWHRFCGNVLSGGRLSNAVLR